MRNIKKYFLKHQLLASRIIYEFKITFVRAALSDINKDLNHAVEPGLLVNYTETSMGKTFNGKHSKEDYHIKKLLIVTDKFDRMSSL